MRPLAGQRRREKQELSCGEVFDDVHGSAADRAVPERNGVGSCLKGGGSPSAFGPPPSTKEDENCRKDTNIH
jgi:hypothetical protein